MSAPRASLVRVDARSPRLRGSRVGTSAAPERTEQATCAQQGLRATDITEVQGRRYVRFYNRRLVTFSYL